MEFVHKGPVMVWDEDMSQYVSPVTKGVLPPKTAAAYFRGMLDGLVRASFPTNIMTGGRSKKDQIVLVKIAKYTWYRFLFIP